jgi:hypothetical protein
MRTPVQISFLVVLALIPISTWAKTPPADVSTASISCGTVFGIAKFKPALVDGGTATSTTIKVKGSVAGCGVGGVNTMFPPLVPSGTFSGTLAGTSNGCEALLAFQPLTGTLTFKWTAYPTTPITPKTTTVNITGIGVSGSSPQGFFIAPWSDYYLQFSFGSQGGTGAFTGGNASMSNNVIMSESIGAFFGPCAFPKGVNTLHFAVGTLSISQGLPFP